MRAHSGVCVRVVSISGGDDPKLTTLPEIMHSFSTFADSLVASVCRCEEKRGKKRAKLHTF